MASSINLGYDASALGRGIDVNKFFDVLTKELDQKTLSEFLGYTETQSLFINKDNQILFDEKGGIPLLVKQLNSKNELLIRNVLFIMFIFSPTSSMAVKIMMHGGVSRIMQLIKSTNEEGSANDTAVTRDIVRFAASTLATLVQTKTVRDLVTQLLESQTDSVRLLVEQCTSKNTNISWAACQTVSFLLLNEANYSALNQFGALKQLEDWCKRMDIVSTQKSSFLSVEEVHLYYPLFNCNYEECIAFLLWNLARATTPNKLVSIDFDKVSALLRNECISLIRVFARHTNYRIRELALMILANLGDTNYITNYTTLEAWLKSINLNGATKIVSQLQSADIDLPLLLDSKLNLDILERSLTRLQLKEGAILKLLVKISDQRNSDEKARKLGATLDSKVSTVVAPSSTSTINSDKQKDSAPQIFISYCWANKTASQKLKQEITNAGLNCWMDEGQMSAGDEYFAKIDKGITDARIIIACISTAYTKSVSCNREVSLSAERNKLIIPVFVDTLDTWPPSGSMGYLLAGKLYIDLSNEVNYASTKEKLINTLKQSL